MRLNLFFHYLFLHGNVTNIILKDKNMVNLHIQGLGSFLNHLDDFI